MDVKLQKKGELGRELTVTVPAGEVAKKLTQRLEKVGQQAKIPGFRPGKVPAKILKQRFGEQVAQELQRDLVSETMAKAFDQEKLQPAAQPQIDFGEVDENTDYTYTMRFDIMPEVEPKGYKGVKLTRQVAKAGDKQTKEALDRLAASMRSFEKKDGKAAKGDVAVITAKGFDAKSGDALEGTEITDHSIEIGSGGLIPGFEDQLAGHKAGDKFDVEVTFPKEYHAKKLAGVKARFETEMKDVKKPISPEIDDEFAKQFGAEGLDDLKDKIAEQLNKDLEEATRQRLKRDLFDALEKKNTFTLPDGMVEQEFQSIWRALMQDMQRSQMTFDQMNKSEDEMRAEHRKLAERRVRIGLVLSEIGQKEDVKVTGPEIQAKAEETISQYPKEYAEKARAYYSSDQGRQEVFGPLFENKVCDWVFENAEISEKKIDAEKLLEELN